jgi:hypothetical protein
MFLRRCLAATRDTYLVSCGQDEREHGAKPALASADPAEASGRIHPPVGWLVAGLCATTRVHSPAGDLHVAMLPASAMCSLVLLAEALPCALTPRSALWQM